MENLIIGIGGILAAIVAISVLIMKTVRKVPPEKAMVVYGVFSKNRNYVSGGGAIVLPFVQDFSVLNISIMTLPIKIQNALSQNGVRINVELNASVKIASNVEMLSKAFEAYGGKNDADIKTDIEKALYGQVREIIADTNIETLTSEDQMEIFQKKVLEKCKNKLSEVGVEIKILNIENFNDDDGFFEAMKAKAIAEKKSKEEIDQADAEKNSRIKKSEFEQEAVMAEEKSRKQREEYKLETERSLAIKREEITKETNSVQKETAIAKEQNETEIAIQRAKKEQSYFIEETKQQKELEIEKQNIEIAKEEKKILAEEARAKSREQKERADIVVPAEAHAKAQIAKADGNKQEQILIAEANKQTILLEAEGQSESLNLISSAEAEQIKVKGKAEAEVIMEIGKAKAESILKQIQSLNLATPAVLQFMMMEKLIPLLPEIINAATQHMANIDNVTLIGGSGDGKSGNPLTQFMEMGPISLMKGFETAKAVGWDVSKLADKFGITLPDDLKDKVQNVINESGVIEATNVEETKTELSEEEDHH